MRERVQATVTSLLGLLGLDADPVRSRDHILLSLILDKAWSEGRSLDLGTLILEIQKPPVERVGVLDLEAFYPARERFSLAMTINNVLAAPGFEAWLAGDPLDVNALLYTPEGRPRHAIFSIAHLNDAERMFFVSTLLNQVVSWMRAQPGTTSLRALLYMDEIAGYLPPVANPPSKAPLMTLLKQARAFGLGVVLATQNPKDIDYKAMSNMGTWFVGRLQTDRDQERVLDGLEGAASGAGATFDRHQMQAALAGLGKRVFLMYDVHEDAPEVFHTRWALSYLPGPLTRDQIKRLSAGAPDSAAAGRATAVAAEGLAVRPRPVLPPEVREFFVPVRAAAPAGATLSYEPALTGFADVVFADKQLEHDFKRAVAFQTPIEDSPTPVDWDNAGALEVDADSLATEPYGAADYTPLPIPAAKARTYAIWSRSFIQWLYTTQRLPLLRSPALKEVSRPEESERDFRVRLELAAREERDRLVEGLRDKFATKTRTIEERIRRAEAVVDREREQARDQQLQSVVSIGTTVLGALFGRKVASRSNLTRAGTAMRSVSRAGRQAGDVRRAQDSLESYREQLAELETQLEEESRLIGDRINPRTNAFETVEVKPKKTNITVQLVGLTWLPYWTDSRQNRRAAW